MLLLIKARENRPWHKFYKHLLLSNKKYVVQTILRGYLGSSNIMYLYLVYHY